MFMTKKDKTNMFIGIKQENADSIGLAGYTISPTKAGVLLGFCGIGVVAVIDEIRKIILPSTITKIGVFAFKDCISLKEIYIPDSIVKINDYAFAGCSSLKEIDINIIKSFNYNIFNGCNSLERIFI